MNAVGIDVSKGKSMVCVMKPFGEVVVSPFEVNHTSSELGKLAKLLKSLDGEMRVVIEYTGNYYQPIARALHDEGIYVSVVNAMLVHDYGNNSLRRAKTDKKDSIKLANYALDRWLSLPQYFPEEDVRQMLKTFHRQYNLYMKLKIMQNNNLIALLDQTFPDVKKLFKSPPRKKDGHKKWMDFALRFWHCECVCGHSIEMFTKMYRKWCERSEYYFDEEKALDIYAAACGHIGLMPKTKASELLVTQAITQLQAVSQTLSSTQREMHLLATKLPEYDTVMSFYGVGPTLGPQLMAEIGDVRRFHSKGALVAFAGIDAPPYQSGTVNIKSRKMSKRGAAPLRKTLFQVMSVILQNKPVDEPVFQFLDKKRSEGKHYYVYMMASSNKFLRIYYAKIKQCIEASDITV